MSETDAGSDIDILSIPSNHRWRAEDIGSQRLQENTARRTAYSPGLSWPDHEKLLTDAETVEDHSAVWEASSAEFEAAYADFFREAVEGSSGFLGREYVRLNLPRIDRNLEPARAPLLVELLRPQLIEDNLEKAAVSLARAAAMNAEYDDKASRAASLALDIKEFIEADRAWRAQVRAGSLSLPIFENMRSWEACGSDIKASVATRARATLMLAQHFPQGPGQCPALVAMVYGAWAAGLNDTGQYAKASFDWGGKQVPLKERPIHGLDAASLHGQHVFGMEYSALQLEHQRGQSGADTASHLHAMAAERVTWSVESARQQIQQHQTAVEITKLKIGAASTSGGSINYAEQAKQAQVLFETEMDHAMARLGAAAAGLHAIHNYPRPLPRALAERLPQDVAARLAEAAPALYNPAHIDTQQKQKLDLLGLAQQWTTEAVSWFSASRHSERRYTIILPLRELFEDDLDEISQPDGASFTVNHQIMSAEGSMRLLAVGLEIVSLEPDNGYWRIELKVPEGGDFEGRNERERAGRLTQAYLPWVLLGKVATQHELRQPSLEGADVVANCSPVGRWRIRSLGPSTTRKALQHAKDVMLHLAVVER